jgi:hypothetical protein
MLVNAFLFCALNIAYFTYLELNPSTKGIVIRMNDKNEKYISFASIINLIVFPYTRRGFSIMWNYKTIDVNYTLMIGIPSLVYYITLG